MSSLLHHPPFKNFIWQPPHLLSCVTTESLLLNQCNYSVIKHQTCKQIYEETNKEANPCPGCLCIVVTIIAVTVAIWCLDKISPKIYPPFPNRKKIISKDQTNGFQNFPSSWNFMVLLYFIQFSSYHKVSFPFQVHSLSSRNKKAIRVEDASVRLQVNMWCHTIIQQVLNLPPFLGDNFDRPLFQ